MGKILLENLEFVAPIGWYAEEQQTGNRFTVSISFSVDFSRAGTSDALADTVNYEDAVAIVQEEMQVPRKLIESTGNALLERFSATFSQLKDLEIRITKHRPFPTQKGDVTLVFSA